MEAAEVKGVAQVVGRLGAQGEEFELAYLVSERLPRGCDVAVDLYRGLVLILCRRLPSGNQSPAAGTSLACGCRYR